MNLGIFTLYEGSYHHGVAALLNSAIHSGFRGCFFAGYRDAIPRWGKRLGADGDRPVEVGGVTLQFFSCRPERHLGYHKPFAALQILRDHPELDGVVYADPDVVLLASWNFIESWIQCGVALCEDSNFPRVHQNHPWRREWRQLLLDSGRAEGQLTESYANSGFFGIARADCETLQTWGDLTLQFEAKGGNTRVFRPAERLSAIVTDQDILAAAMMTSGSRVSLLGPEGMGFNGHFLVLAHAIESPKPWDTCHTARALRGDQPSRASNYYLRFLSGPCQARHKLAGILKGMDMAVAKLIGRVYRR